MVTIKDVAKACGVSIATVNRAISDKPDVSQKTREKVLKKIDELGYIPQFMARSLVSGKTHIIGLIVFDVMNPFFGELTAVINRLLRKRGYRLQTCIIDNSLEDEKEAINHLASLNVDGILFIPLHKSAEFASWIKKLPTKVISLLNELDNEIDFLGVGEKEAMETAVGWIHQKGYERLLYLSPPLHWRGNKNLDTIERRLEGVMKASEHLFPGSSLEVRTDEGYLERSREWLRESSQKSAILCSNDIYALDILKASREWGLKIPQDFGLMGFDNIDTLRYLETDITSVYYPVEKVAKAAVECLFSQHEKPIHQRFPTKIRHGESL
ncbi:MAG: LacI family transcriptional regulator [Spirochaetales bacterium]|nr:LacI family transcriptional regulator [Spirochaetales bacterium]